MRIADDVHVADVRGDLVFLDAARDQYLCIARNHALHIRELLFRGQALRTPEEAELLDELVEAGMLTESVRPDEAGLEPPPPMATLDRFALAAPVAPLHSRHVAGLLLARLVAWVRLKHQPPARWLSSQGSRRQLAASGSRAAAVVLANHFDRLRPWLPGRGCCLPSSLTLLEFLRLHKVAATLVFGVRTYPFEAHCWVEHDGVVLNDTLEHVRWFTPIVAA